MPRTLYPASLATFLNSGVPYQRVDLWTITLQSGLKLRYVDHEYSLTRSDSAVFSRDGPMITRTGVTQRRGLEASEMTLKIVAPPTAYVYGTVPWMRAFEAGVFDYASVSLDVGILSIGAPTVLVGWYSWFEGEAGETLSIGLACAELRVRNFVARLKTQMPRNLVQPGCLNDLFDKACGVNKATYTRTGVPITSIGGDGAINTNIPPSVPAAGFYDEGTMIFTSGDNSNVVRKIKKYTPNVFYLFAPPPFTVAGGTTITVIPGCAKTRTACTAFSNDRFRGMPYVPTPETIL